MPRFIGLIAALVLSLSLPTATAAPSLDVEISGVEKPLLENIKLLLTIEQQKTHPQLSEGRIRRLHEKAAEEIKRALEPFSYYRATINASLTLTDERWLARYEVNPGPPLRLTQSEVRLTGEGQEDSSFQELVAKAAPQADSVLDQIAYEQFKRDLQRLAEERGYFDADFTTHRIQIDLANYQASISLHYDTGPRYRFGAVTFSGEYLINESLLRRFIPFRQGELFHNRALQELQNGLTNSDYFEQVFVRVERNQASGVEVPITVQGTMRKRTRYLFGLGFGTDTGPRGSIGMERRYVNREGHRFNADIKASQIRQSTSARYSIPLKNPRTDRLLYQAEHSVEQVEDIDTESSVVGVHHEHSYGKWQRSYGLDYHYENFKIGVQTGRTTLLIPSIRWIRIADGSGLHSANGRRINLHLRGAHEAVVSEQSFAQAVLGGKLIHSLNAGRLIARTELGSTWVDEFAALPPSIRFFAGGDYSVRGYAYKSLGPQDSAGNVIGGKSLFTASLEYEYAFNERWSGALFYDTGNAFDQFGDALVEGAGFGLRRRLPIGWLRVDLAQALSKDGDPWRLHLTLGPDL